MRTPEAARDPPHLGRRGPTDYGKADLVWT